MESRGKKMTVTGRQTYEMWCKKAGEVTTTGDPRTSWEALSESHQGAWDSVAELMILPDGPPDPG